MEGIREAALVHFDNASPLERDRMVAMFLSMDTDEDGRISKTEFQELMNKYMPTNEISWLFNELDQDGSGSLEFGEFKTYYYAIISRPVCDCCKELVAGLYYCCVRCWEMHLSDVHDLFQPFQVCVQCFLSKLFQHDHTEFLDHHVLFRSKEISALTREKKVKENLEMEAALKAGRSYYLALSETGKNVAYNLFAEMDVDGDGKVSVNELISFLTDEETQLDNACKVIQGMDLSGDRYLSIEDVGALMYISLMRPCCDRCKARIMGTYYSCVVCHNMSTNGADNDTYDLCPECYCSGEFQHEHDLFLDNFALLRVKNELPGQGSVSSSNGGGQGAAASSSGGGQEMAASSSGGGQKTARSSSAGGQETATSCSGGGQGTGKEEEGTKNLSKREMLEIMAHAATVTGVTLHVAAGSLCSIM
ncbi:uncharacterized protein LOC131249826 [Magnolia sinica]|uniref:uncharacterized protein LOC131249826 n=1 Tax=Magnolia sinica TaxID=86752 RepID=UPI0026588901|nr:uncharacterized protein LOC131249826 [Magnolia sinica]